VITFFVPVMLAGCTQPAPSQRAAADQYDPPPPAAASHTDAAEVAAPADGDRGLRAEISGAEAAKGRTTNPSNTAEPKRAVVVYYFHRTLRCPTCLSIEEQARKAVRSGFASKLDHGTIVWRAVNIEQAGNEHFEKDFELSASSLIVVEMKGEEPGRWKNLGRVWELVNDGPAFRRYVQAEVASYLE
jgi:hypothetical protein